MNKKILIAILIVVVAFLGFISVYAVDNSSDDVNRTTLNVSSEGPIKLSKLVNEIRTHEYYKGYDNETLAWMESLGEKYVWVSNDGFVIMDNVWDSNKIPSAYVCDAYFREIFSCRVLENHTLVKGNHSKDVVLVNNVEFIKQENYYYEV